MPDVESRGGLVEQVHGRVLGQQPRVGDPLLLAPGQGRHHPVRQMADVGDLHRPRHAGVVLVLPLGTPPDRAPHLDDLPDPEAEGQGVALQEHGATSGQLRRRLAVHGLAVEQHVAGGRHPVAGQHREQRRLSGAVGSHQGDQLAVSHVEVDVGEDGGALDPHADPAGRERRAHAQPPAVRRARRSSQKKMGPPTRDVSMPMGRSA